MVVVVQGDQVAQLEMACCRGGLGGNTFHGTSITEEHVRVVIANLETWLVEYTTRVRLCNGKTNSVTKTLSKRSGSHLDTWGIVGFWVTRANAVHSLFCVSDFRTQRK